MTDHERVTIPGVCHIRRQGTEIRCTLPPHTSGDHRNYYYDMDWPPRPGETQAS